MTFLEAFQLTTDLQNPVERLVAYFFVKKNKESRIELTSRTWIAVHDYGYSVYIETTGKWEKVDEPDKLDELLAVGLLSINLIDLSIDRNMEALPQSVILGLQLKDLI